MMSMGGTIYGMDRKGNAKVMPAGGGRPVILRKSAGTGFRIWDRVLYDGVIPGEVVDFTENHRVLPQTHKTPPGFAPRAFEARIRNTLSNHKLYPNSVILVYEPEPAFMPARQGNGGGTGSFHYLAMARTAEAADSVVGQINQIFNPFGKYGLINDELSVAGRQGELFGVGASKFAGRVSDLPGHNLALVPVQGIVSRINGDALISVPVMKTCLQQAAIVLDSVSRRN